MIILPKSILPTVLLLSFGLASGDEQLRYNKKLNGNAISELTGDDNEKRLLHSNQKCGGAVNSSSDSQATCQRDLWNPTGDSSMHCFAYGGSGDPCHLNNNNDPDDGIFKDPSACNGDTLYLWDEPDTQGRSYSWAGSTWLEYSKRFPQQLEEFRARGGKITSPLIRAGGPGVIAGNLQQFFNSCGAPCSDPSDQAYIDIIAINAFCGDFNGPAGCSGGASFIYNEAVQSSNGLNNLPVYITNWSRLQTSNPQDQVDAIDAIEEFFPNSNSVIERVYWFGATDFGGGSSNNLLTQDLGNGSTLGQLWREKCNSLNPNPTPTPPMPTNAPVAAPTNAPVAAPTDVPVAAPTDAPVAAPTNATPHKKKCRDIASNRFTLPNIGKVKERTNTHCKWFGNVYKNRRIKRKYCIRKVRVTKGPKKGKMVKLNLICKEACMDINAGNKNLNCI